MLAKRIGSVKKLAKKVKATRSPSNAVFDLHEPSPYECLLTESSGDDQEARGSSSPLSNKLATPTGSFAVYVGDERQRFVVPTSYLTHPLFKMLLDKAYNEFGFQQRNGLVVPCSVAAFQEVVSAVECCNCNFDFGDLVEEFV